MAGCVVLAIGGCGDDADDAGSADTTLEVDETTTTTAPPDSTTTTGASTGTTAAGGEGTTDLEDGEHPVFVTAVDVEGRTLTVDVVQFLTGEEAAAAYEAETGETGGPPNDYFIVNENDRLRTLPVADDVDVQLVRLAEDGDAASGPGTFDELATYDATTTSPFWLTLDGGVVVTIEEQYVP